MNSLRKNICKMKEDDDYVWVKAVCPCGCDDHQTIFVQIDKYGQISAEIYYTLDATQYWGGWLQAIKKAVKIFFKRPVRIEGEFLFDEESLEDYIQTLQEALKKMKEKDET